MILILDFGSQYTQIIARQLRDLQIYCEVVSFFNASDSITQKKWLGIILSGGPNSVYNFEETSNQVKIFDAGLPVLGICYGMQLIAQLLGGKVVAAKASEYGETEIELTSLASDSPLFDGIDTKKLTVWMSHKDYVAEMPPNFIKLASSDNCAIVAMQSITKNIYAVQFHPEVSHTQKGILLVKNFVKKICACRANWNMKHFYEQQVEFLKTNYQNKKILAAVSGGVDSLVATKLITQALPNSVTAVLIDNGFMRSNEIEEITRSYITQLGIKPIVIKAEDYFLNELKNVIDPEIKRKKIGQAFIKIFQEKVPQAEIFDYLLQGTLYSDVIESATVGPSKTIKTHHNVGGLPDKMRLKLIEPLRILFKDEVRKLGVGMGLPKNLIFRHPFPGPGLAVRIIGEVNLLQLQILKKCDAILIDELTKSNQYSKVWQAFAVLLPIKSVGVTGDRRNYSQVIALRCINSKDAMTAKWSKLPYELLGKISTRIVNEVNEVGRVVYDITNKPPATIEWE